MFGIGIPEFILILIVGLIVFGPSKLPEIGRAVGKGMREFRRASSALQEAMHAPEPERTVRAGTEKPKPVKEELPVEEKEMKPEMAGEEQSIPKEADAVAEPPVNGGYEPPTQESVRRQIEAQKAELQKAEVQKENA